MNRIDKVISDIISQPIAEAYATKLFEKAINADSFSEHLQNMSIEEAAENLEALDGTPKSARIKELTIQSQAAQQRLSIHGLLSDSGLYLPRTLLPHIEQIEYEIVLAAIGTYIDENPEIVETLISTAREMVDLESRDVEHYELVTETHGVGAKHREMVADYLCELIQNQVMEQLDEALKKATRNS